jgi:enamine deaminase RidA (YjgF/YER057c/UK114 family)
MRLTLFSWLDHEFAALSGEGKPGLGAAEATRELLGRYDAQLRAHGLSLDNTVRTRLFARDEPGRLAASNVRREVLGDHRGGSSSFVVPAIFDSQGVMAFDLVAMRPSHPGADKTFREYDPPRGPLRYVAYDGIVFLSGVARGGATLADQVPAVLDDLSESLALAGTSWEKVVLVSCFLQTGQDLGLLQRLVRQSVPIGSTRLECEVVDDYAVPGSMLEIEATAVP